MLVAINNVGAIHGNIRLDNIIVILDRYNEQIIKVGFTGLEYLTKCDDSINLIVPERLDHLPPDVSIQLIKIWKLSGSGKCSSVGSKQ